MKTSGGGFNQTPQYKITKPVLKWSVTSGIVDAASGRPAFSLMAKDVVQNPEVEENPKQALREIANSGTSGIYILLDFHPYLDDPFITRTIKQIAQNYKKSPPSYFCESGT
jgi:hypothetical protein|tara:strand:+ start:183 stop:515 length:333 start_codon:yes stop_codon:yes gene_type:complete